MNLPKSYDWLKFEGAPRHLLKALELYGVEEKVGTANNPVIMGWAKEVGLGNTYKADSIPWCGLFMAVVMKRASREPVKDPLWAMNWTNFGVPINKPMLGDVLIFTRNGGGHVGIYIGEDRAAYHVLGGNQGNAVNVKRIAKERLTAVRRPAYNLQPANIRRIELTNTGGGLSINEA